MSELQTIGRLFLKRINLSQKNLAIGWIENQEIKSYNYLEYKNLIEQLSCGLVKHGFQTGDKIAILAATCKEWHLLDLATLCSRGVVVPIYPSYVAKEVSHIITHSDSSIVVVENDSQFEKLNSFFITDSPLKLVITLNDISEDNVKKVRNLVPLIHYKTLLQDGIEFNKTNPDLFENHVNAQKGDELASIIYTSGTTGEPKGAMITNDAMVNMLHNVQEFVQGAFGSNDRTLTFLPLSHVLGRCDSLLPLIFGWHMVFAESLEKIVDNLTLVQPTIMLAVPRIFEKMYTKIWEHIEKGGPVQKRIFEMALFSAKSYFKKIDHDRSPNAVQLISYKTAQELIFSKIVQKFGGKIRYFVSGGAPLSPTIIEFLRYANLTILEGYGLTETIAPCALNPLSRQKTGTVGRPIGDVAFKFADDGEILIKSNALFSGYYKNPEATKEAFEDGWFKSGDIGHFTEDGFLKITDRKKDILITSGGKNVAPQKIENLMKAKKHITQFVVVGDSKKFLTALVGIEKESFLPYFNEWGLSLDTPLKDLALDPRVKDLIQKDIDQVNHELAQYETIKNFHILPEEMTLQNYLTPSLKIKRKLILKEYSKQIEALYH